FSSDCVVADFAKAKLLAADAKTGSGLVELFVDGDTLRGVVSVLTPTPSVPATVTLPFGTLSGSKRRTSIDMMGSKVPLEIFFSDTGVPLTMQLELPFGTVEVRCASFERSAER